MLLNMDYHLADSRLGDPAESIQKLHQHRSPIRVFPFCWNILLTFSAQPKKMIHQTNPSSPRMPLPFPNSNGLSMSCIKPLATNVPYFFLPLELSPPMSVQNHSWQNPAFFSQKEIPQNCSPHMTSVPARFSLALLLFKDLILSMSLKIKPVFQEKIPGLPYQGIYPFFRFLCR